MTVQRSRVEVALVAAVVLLASSLYCVAQSAAVTGTVRDASGVAQLGVLVQVSGADSSQVRRAFTDLKGRYLFTNLAPGQYMVQATAAMFTPATKPNLQLRDGARAIVDLTMSTLFDTTAWLPAERRKADEPQDDWKWTLRSAANRPILRIVDDGELVMVSSSAAESHAPSRRGRAAVTNGDGGFGGGGLHTVLTMDAALEDGSDVVLRADSGAGRTQYGIAPSTEMSAGMERRAGIGTTLRGVSSFQSHPEMLSAGNVAGLQTMELATAQRTRLGDTVSFEAGGATYAVHTTGYGLVAQPFLRVMVEPAAGWTFGYRMATSRDLQGYAALDAVQPEIPVAVMTAKGVRTERGRHQEVSVTRKVGRGQVQAAVYKDSLKQVAMSGAGALTSADLNDAGNGSQAGAIADALTGGFRVLTSGYEARGIHLLMTQPLAQGLWAAVEYSTGSGLESSSAGECGNPQSLPTLLAGLRKRQAQAATVALKGNLPGTSTKLRAVYRWQPRDLLTAVDTYREFSDQAFLSFHVRQPMHWSGVLPPGLEASVDVSNLLAQGYQPFLSSDGRTLYLAQTPRTLQAGLSINF